MTLHSNTKPTKRYGWIIAISLTLLLGGFQYQYERFTTTPVSQAVVQHPVNQRSQPTPTCTFASFKSIQDHFRWKPGRKPLILAHRGGPTDSLPENALETLRYTAGKISCPILEFDVRMTRDSVLVIAHGDGLDGHTTGTGLISQKDWKAVHGTKLLTPSHRPTPFGIATFDEILAGCKDKGILAIDAKPGTDLDKVQRAVVRHGAMHQSFLICYWIKDALKVSRKKPDLMLAVGFNKFEDIATIRQSGLPLARLIALTPRTLQPKSYYDAIHALGIICSMGTYGEGTSMSNR